MTTRSKAEAGIKSNPTIGLALLSLLLITPLPAPGSSDHLPEDRGAVGLWQTLRGLQTTASVLQITAHPDDEDGPTLTLLARGRGVRTLLLTMNRGEGGANLVAPFFFDELGVLRTLEMLEAARHYGVEQFFTRAVDYGYSKRLEEALEKWGEENILRDVVRVVRRERPDIILARFRGTPSEGHATTYVVALMARQAFEMAGDPNSFPEQIAEGLRPWQPKKLYLHARRPDARRQEAVPATVVVDPGTYDPVLGHSYFQLSREGLGLERSQGQAGRPAPAGPFPVHYELVGAADPTHNPQQEESFFDGLNTSIAGIAANAGPNTPAWLRRDLRKIERAVTAAAKAFDITGPEATIRALVGGLKATRTLQARVKGSGIEEEGRDHILFLLDHKEEQFQEALRRALALDLTAAVEPLKPPTGPAAAFLSADTFNHAIPGQSFSARVRLVNRSRVEITPTAVEIQAPPGWGIRQEEISLQPLGTNEILTTRFQIQVAKDAEPTRPYWLRASIHEAVYQIDDPTYHTYPLPPPPAWGMVQLEVEGVLLTIKDALRILKRDPAYGELTPPLAIVPAIGVAFANQYGIIPLGQKDYKVSVVVRSSVKGAAEGTVRLRLPPGWTSSPEFVRFTLAKEDEESTFDFNLSVPDNLREQSYTIEAVARYDGRDYSEGYATVTARDLGRFNHYRPARHHVHGVDVKVAQGLRLGYVMGSGDDIPQSLGQLGLRPEMLSAADLAATDLSAYNAILIGVRAYAVRSDVKTYNGRLLDYVRNGGVLIVQYQTPEYDNNYGPYPYTQTNQPEEVSEEDAPVTILAPENSVFNHPNKITPADFEGWVEQRGSKFLKSWDPRYIALLETHDQNQEPQRGGMIYARYGQGVYLYSAYAWYRQLPYAVPGAFRIFANMISLRRTLAEQGQR